VSLEKQARRALRRAVFFRLLSAFVATPADLFSWVAGAFGWLAALCREAETALFYFELDAARTYRNVTGFDLGLAAGAEERYMGTRPGAWEEAVKDASYGSFEAAAADMDEDDD
jgi:hypothetical protein